MSRKVSLRTRLTCSCLCLTVLPLAAVLVMIVLQNRQMSDTAARECRKLVEAGQQNLVKNLLSLCRTEHGLSNRVALAQGPDSAVDAAKHKPSNNLRQTVLDTIVGETGYAFVLDSKGKYIISQGGKRDGEDIWEAKDSEGVAFIQEMCAAAKNLPPGQVQRTTYYWQNPGEQQARAKVSYFGYFPEWDWVVGLGAYEEELLRAEQNIRAQGNRTELSVFALAFAVAVLAVFFCLRISRALSRSIDEILSDLRDFSETVVASSDQVSQSSQALAEGASEQAASLEEVSAAIHELKERTDLNARNASLASVSIQEARKSTAQGEQAMNSMLHVVEEIKLTSDQTVEIVKTIDGIAFQTNLLALNAAVEAARAGDAGRGFAVVADEVRSLAYRSAKAAQNTQILIDRVRTQAQQTVEVSNSTAHLFGSIATNVSQVAQLNNDVADASNAQAAGIEQIDRAIHELSVTTQTVAAHSEENAAAGEELRSQAFTLKPAVERLSIIVHGQSNAETASELYATSDIVSATRDLDGIPASLEKRLVRDPRTMGKKSLRA